MSDEEWLNDEEGADDGDGLAPDELPRRRRYPLSIVTLVLCMPLLLVLLVAVVRWIFSY